MAYRKGGKQQETPTRPFFAKIWPKTDRGRSYEWSFYIWVVMNRLPITTTQRTAYFLVDVSRSFIASSSRLTDIWPAPVWLTTSQRAQREFIKLRWFNFPTFLFSLQCCFVRLGWRIPTRLFCLRSTSISDLVVDRYFKLCAQANAGP